MSDRVLTEKVSAAQGKLSDLYMEIGVVARDRFGADPIIPGGDYGVDEIEVSRCYLRLALEAMGQAYRLLEEHDMGHRREAEGTGVAAR